MSNGVLLGGPFVGLTYTTPSGTGVTGDDGQFSYQPGEEITFSLGNLKLGAAQGASSLSVLDLVSDVPATGALLHDGVTQRMRLLLAFATDLDYRCGVSYSTSQLDAINRWADQIDFDTVSDTFDSQPAILGLCAELGLTMPSAESVRNHLRRSLAGIRLLRDVEIPMRDGARLSADVFLPVGERKAPSIMRLSVYGKAFRNGSAITPEQLHAADQREEHFFEGDRSTLFGSDAAFENTVSANAFDWVPQGYAVVRVDARGVGKSAGTLAPFSKQEAEDYYDAIQWVAEQDWSDGKVGLVGGSYNASNQWAVAALKPPALRAIIPFAPDQDGYRELAYPGGIYNEDYRNWWFREKVLFARPDDQGHYHDLLADLKSHPFDDEWWRNSTDAPVAVDFSAIEVPVLTSISQTMMLHSRGAVEAFNKLGNEKHLYIVDATYHSFMCQDTLGDQFRFMERHMKGGAPKLPAVRSIVRQGGGELKWRESETWPISGTEYRAVFLDATTQEARWEAPTASGRIEYPADAPPESTHGGAHFQTAPLSEDLELLGHFRAHLFVSSSSHDSDVYVALRVFDGDREVFYPTREPDPKGPLAWGFLRTSRRATDPELSTTERPWHTHKESDEAPLVPGQIVGVDIEIPVATGVVRAGHHIRIDVTAAEGPGSLMGLKRYSDPTYHAGATNSIHTGPDHPSRVILPVVPPV